MTKPILIGILILIISSCATKRKGHSEEFIKTQNELTEKITKVSAQSAFNGFGVALTNDKEVLYQNGFGYANVETGEKYTENTIQNIASVSKTFVGIAIMKPKS